VDDVDSPGYSPMCCQRPLVLPGVGGDLRSDRLIVHHQLQRLATAARRYHSPARLTASAKLGRSSRSQATLAASPIEPGTPAVTRTRAASGQDFLDDDDDKMLGSRPAETPRATDRAVEWRAASLPAPRLAPCRLGPLRSG